MIKRVRHLKSICFFAFFLSGFAALVYELTWIRLLKNIFGSESLALSSLLTVFIGGIALGQFLAGQIIKKLFSPSDKFGDELNYAIHKAKSYLLVKFYILVELVIGVYALFIPYLLSPNALGKLWQYIASMALEHAILGTLLKFTVSSLVLILPTLLIGMSFPALSELLTSNLEHSDDDTDPKLASSNLYATHTLGSILGTLSCGFVLLPQLGLIKSIYIASGLNLVIVVIVNALLWANKAIFDGVKTFSTIKFILEVQNKKEIFAGEPEHSFKVKDDRGLKLYQKMLAILFSIGFLLGFLNLSLEVIWTKVAALIIGSSNYSITIILTIVLAGISLGAYFANYVVDQIKKHELNFFDLFKTILATFALLIFLSSTLFNQLPWFFIQVNNFISSLNTDQSWLLENLSKYLTISVVIFPVTFVEGLAFAYILFLASSDTDLIENTAQDPIGTRVARTSFWNTLGAIIGSFLTGFVFIPFFSGFGSGVYLSLKLLIALGFFTAFLPYLLDKQSIFNKRVLVLVIAALLCFSLLPPLDLGELNSGVSIYKNQKYKNIKKKDFDKDTDKTILFYKEGVNSIVSVVEDKAANAIFLKNNGKIEAGIPIDYSSPSKADMPTQVLLGALAPLLNPEASNALLIGMGSGVSLKNLTEVGRNTKLDKIDVCEIEKEIFTAADKFFVKQYPNSVKIKRHVMDARNFLAGKTKQENFFYDIIISQPSDPWLSGSLFTQEFWQLASSNLSESGIFAQWLQLYAIEPEYLGIALRTFNKIYPYTYVFKAPTTAELILIGSKSAVKFQEDQINKIIQEKNLDKALEYIGIDSASDLLARLIIDPPSLASLIAQNKNYQNDKSYKKNKFISSFAPKKGKHKIKLNNTEVSRDDFNQLLSTDDNMLLELHTSKALNNFFTTIKDNINLLSPYVNAENIFKLLAYNKDDYFIHKLIRSHNDMLRFSQIYKLNLSKPQEPRLENIYLNNIHGKLANNLAQIIHEIEHSPASYYNLYLINRKRDMLEAADAILQEAGSKFAEVFIRRKRKLSIVESLNTNHKLSKWQYLDLSLIYSKLGKIKQAQTALDYSSQLNNQSQSDDLDYLQTQYTIQATIQKQELKELSKLNNKLSRQQKIRKQKLISEINFNLNKASDFNNQSYNSVFAEAKFALESTEYREQESSRLKQFALSKLELVTKLNPLFYPAQIEIAKIHYQKLPTTQMQYLDILHSNNNSELAKIDKVIKYLKNSLTLNPLSVEANHLMSKLQHNIGNIDLAYKHSSRLRKICFNEILCQDRLSPNELNEAKQLYQKLKQIFVK